jgi:membrane-bound inhibitor of C-type lysozyme
MNMKKSDIIGSIVIIAVLVGGYFLLSKKSETKDSDTLTNNENKVHYSCRIGSIDAIYKETSVVLSLSDKRIIDLPQTRSASGIRYEQSSIVFVSKGENAFLEENGKTTYEDCVADAGGGPTTLGTSTFVDQGKTISFSYPKDFSVSGGGIGYTQSWRANATGMGMILAKATLPKSSQPQTNFSEATFTVGTSSDTKEVQDCLKPTNGEQIGTGTKTIGGVPHVKFTFSGAGAGNFYDTTSYRTLRGGNQCYSIEYTIHSTNIGNYSPDQGIKEFDKQKIVGELESIVSSFSFLSSKASVDSDSSIKGTIVGLSSVTPLSIVEDSRCHVGVQCIWAGTVKVRVRVTNGKSSVEDVVTLLEPKTIAGISVTLAAVSPEATDKVLKFSDYRFEFSTK